MESLPNGSSNLKSTSRECPVGFFVPTTTPSIITSSASRDNHWPLPSYKILHSRVKNFIYISRECSGREKFFFSLTTVMDCESGLKSSKSGPAYGTSVSISQCVSGHTLCALDFIIHARREETKRRLRQKRDSLRGKKTPRNSRNLRLITRNVRYVRYGEKSASKREIPAPGGHYIFNIPS